MSEKVKLPKAVCDAIDNFLKSENENKLLYNHAKFCEQEVTLIPIETFELAKALVLGYEPEITPEEEIKELYDKNYCTTIGDDYDHGRADGYVKAMYDVLKVFGIKYDWMD